MTRVRDDYADFLVHVDKVTPEVAMAKANKQPDFWHSWLFEQCNLWEDVERLGTLVTTSTLFKTKVALDRRRGRDLHVVGFLEDSPMPLVATGA